MAESCKPTDRDAADVPQDVAVPRVVLIDLTVDADVDLGGALAEQEKNRAVGDQFLAGDNSRTITRVARVPWAHARGRGQIHCDLGVYASMCGNRLHELGVAGGKGTENAAGCHRN